MIVVCYESVSDTWHWPVFGQIPLSNLQKLTELEENGVYPIRKFSPISPFGSQDSSFKSTKSNFRSCGNPTFTLSTKVTIFCEIGYRKVCIMQESPLVIRLFMLYSKSSIDLNNIINTAQLPG